VVDGGEELTSLLGSAQEIAVMYYLMNDQTALADSTNWTGGAIFGLHEMGSGIAGKAMTMIRDRIKQLEEGRVVLNESEDEEWFTKEAGIKPYAFDNSPLIRMFMKSEKCGSQET
jgi:hypothetical protein